MQLSLIIPVYKVEQYISYCLNSILHQIKDRENVEIIIVNDGSPDKSMNIVKNLTRDFKNINIIDQKNEGLSIARNNGLKKSQGKYVWFIDSDDWLLSNAIDDVLSYIDNNPDTPVFSTILEMHYENHNKIIQEYNPTNKDITGKEYLKLKYKQGASQRFIIKKSFLTNLNLSFYPNILHEDGLFGYTMLYYAKRIQILENCVYAYRIRETGSIMSSISMRTPKDMLFIHKQLIQFCENNVSEEDKQWYRLTIFSILSDLFEFSKELAFNKEFGHFYRLNKTYINTEIDFILKNKHTKLEKCFNKMYIFKYFPLTYLKFKLIVKRILQK